VQSGFGRLGPQWWGFERHGLDPDLVVLGKPMGNGYPVSAVAGRANVLDPFGADVRYFSTFAGADVGMAVAAEVLRQLRGGIVDRVEGVGRRLREEVASLSASTPGIASVRGAGLYLGVEFRDAETSQPDPRAAVTMSNALRRARVLASVSGAHENVLKVRPPLVFDDAHVTEFTQAYAEALAEV